MKCLWGWCPTETHLPCIFMLRLDAFPLSSREEQSCSSCSLKSCKQIVLYKPPSIPSLAKGTAYCTTTNRSSTSGNDIGFPKWLEEVFSYSLPYFFLLPAICLKKSNPTTKPENDCIIRLYSNPRLLQIALLLCLFWILYLLGNATEIYISVIYA